LHLVVVDLLFGRRCVVPEHGDEELGFRYARGIASRAAHDVPKTRDGSVRPVDRLRDEVTSNRARSIGENGDTAGADAAGCGRRWYCGRDVGGSRPTRRERGAELPLYLAKTLRTPAATQNEPRDGIVEACKLVGRQGSSTEPLLA